MRTLRNALAGLLLAVVFFLAAVGRMVRRR